MDSGVARGEAGRGDGKEPEDHEEQVEEEDDEGEEEPVESVAKEASSLGDMIRNDKSDYSTVRAEPCTWLCVSLFRRAWWHFAVARLRARGPC